MNKTYQEVCDELELANQRLEESAARIQELETQIEDADKMHTAYCCVLDHATGGRMSKAYHDYRMVCGVIDEHVTEQIDDALRERDEAAEALATAKSEARRELVNMIEWPPARRQAEQARQRLEFDEEIRRAKRKGAA